MAGADAARVGVDVDPVLGGEVVEPGAWPSVVALVAGQSLCTGTLVSSRVVLTAAHCMTDLARADRVQVWTGGDQSGPPVAESSDWAAHPSWCGSPDCSSNPQDFAYVVLPEPIEISEYPQPITDPEEWNDLMASETPVGIVGYGRDDEGTSGTKRIAATRLGFVADNGVRFFAGGQGRDSCQGDSGGPAFVRSGDDVLRLAGILSSGSNPCGNGGYYGAPITALEWLEQETGYVPDSGSCRNYACILDGPGCTLAPSGRGHAGTVWACLLGLALSRKLRRRC